MWNKASVNVKIPLAARPSGVHPAGPGFRAVEIKHAEPPSTGGRREAAERFVVD